MLPVPRIRYYPHPDLETVAAALEPGEWAPDCLDRIVNQMLQTMQACHGVGLAGNQVGLLKRVYVTLIPGDQPRAFINPTIVHTVGDPVDVSEGCLSFPGSPTKELRYAELVVSAMTCVEDYVSQTYREVSLLGLAAQAAQHEIEHLDGVTLATRMSPVARDIALRKAKKAARRAER